MFLADVVNRANVGMVQRRRRLGLSLETRQGCGILREFGREKFQCDKTMEPGVFGFLDDPHAAAAQLFNNAVVRDGVNVHIALVWTRMLS